MPHIHQSSPRVFTLKLYYEECDSQLLPTLISQVAEDLAERRMSIPEDIGVMGAPTLHMPVRVTMTDDEDTLE